jgi:hypothetical protein
MCPVSGHARTAPTLRAGAFSSCIPRPSPAPSAAERLHAHSGGASGWVVFPPPKRARETLSVFRQKRPHGVGLRKGRNMQTKAASPTGGAPGIMAGVAPVISTRFHIGFSRGVPHAYHHHTEAVLFAAVLRTLGGFRPPSRLGPGTFHAPDRRSGRQFAALPVPSGYGLSFLQRQHKMPLMRLSSAAPRTFGGPCPLALRRYAGGSRHDPRLCGGTLHESEVLP